ncbi:MAG TPA: hypothetical protein VGK67_09590 [Myxococcales bacterium]|jgi:hypothetical protein
MERRLSFFFSFSFLLAVVLAGCGPGFEGEGQPGVSVLVKDAPAQLTGGEEALFEIRYCADAQGESFLVSELRAELDAQGMNWHSGWDLRYELTVDANRDHRFGPGDAITVSEKDWNEFGADDAGMTYGVTLYRVSEMGRDEVLAKADWQAR